MLVYLPGREGLHDTGGAGNTQLRPGCERRGEKGMAATKAVSDNDSDRKRAEWGQDRGVETHGNQKAWSTLKLPLPSMTTVALPTALLFLYETV